MTPAERDELETLREENRQLKAVLRDKGIAVYRGLHFTPAEDFVLSTLLRAPGGCSIDRFLVGSKMSPGSLRIHVYHLRTKIKVVDPLIKIKVAYGGGYIIPADHKTRIADLKVIS